jgi:hypothetical protein
MPIASELARASRTGQPVRVHTSDGEVVVARVLSFDGLELVYFAVTSNRPERYAVCDATGFALPLEAIERVQLLREPAAPRRPRPRTP